MNSELHNLIFFGGDGLSYMNLYEELCCQICFLFGIEYVKLLPVFCHIVIVDNDPWIESKHVRIEVISTNQKCPISFLPF